MDSDPYWIRIQWPTGSESRYLKTSKNVKNFKRPLVNWEIYRTVYFKWLLLALNKVTVPYYFFQSFSVKECSSSNKKSMKISVMVKKSLDPDPYSNFRLKMFPKNGG